jgi:8-oxo-dGTP diphosphatase
MEERIIQNFGNKLRVRICGILIEDHKILLVKHRYIGKNKVLWAPPGGGMQFNENAENCLVREFEEETGLKIVVDRFLFTHEFLNPPLHAIELFFRVNRRKGDLKKGVDPEMKKGEQIIERVSFLNLYQLKKINTDSLHYVLRTLDNLNDLYNLDGYVKFEDFT